MEAGLRSFLSNLTEDRRHHVRPPEIIPADKMSRRGLVGALIRYASDRRADLIVCQHRDAQAFSTGKFSETLLFRSRIPVLIVGGPRGGERGKGLTRVRKIVFPTDFGSHALSEFHQAVELARRFRAELIVFHSVEYPADPEYAAGYTSTLTVAPHLSFLEAMVKSAEKRFRSWERLAIREGVSTRLILDHSGRPVWRRLVQIARKEQADLVAMATRRGPISSVLLGSVTRLIVREMPCAVWVLKHGRRIRSEVESRAAA
jgi:nucleotide-binding universal stress UspA family protein